MEQHLPGSRECFAVCGVEMDENEMEEHTERNHTKTERQCVKCPKIYINNDQLKRHMWRAHTTTDCSLCDTTMESRQDLKHHKENVHKVTKQMECKYAKEGTCIDGRECLFHHDEDKTSDTSKTVESGAKHTYEIKCQQCPKEYETVFKLKRHGWRSHEHVDCRLCGQGSESRQDLEMHKQTIHGITRQRSHKFYAIGKCIDGKECLFSHKEEISNDMTEHIKNNHIESEGNVQQVFCK